MPDESPDAELRRFYVVPDAGGNGVRLPPLDTGDNQHAAIHIYRNHGFAEVPRLGPYVDNTTSICT